MIIYSSNLHSLHSLPFWNMMSITFLLPESNRPAATRGLIQRRRAPIGIVLRKVRRLWCPVLFTLVIVFYAAHKINFHRKPILSIGYTMISILAHPRWGFIRSQKLCHENFVPDLTEPIEYLFRVCQTMSINRSIGHNVSVIFWLPVAGSAPAAGIECYWWERDGAMESVTREPPRGSTSHPSVDVYRVLKYWHLIQRQVPEQYWFWVLSRQWKGTHTSANAGFSANTTLLWFNKLTNKYCPLFCQSLSSAWDQFTKQTLSIQRHEPLFVRLRRRLVISANTSPDNYSDQNQILFFYLYWQI